MITKTARLVRAEKAHVKAFFDYDQALRGADLARDELYKADEELVFAKDEAEALSYEQRD